MAKFLGLEDSAMERTSLQQRTTELNSSDNSFSFFLDKGSRLSFRALTTTLSTLNTRIEVVVRDINNFRQFLPLINQGASLAGGV
jgi:hypothetical protein